VQLGTAAGVLAILAFCVLAAGGLPIRTRYLMLAACVLALFAGAGLFGWRTQPAGARRTWWARLSVVALAAFVVTAPNQIDRIGSLRDALATQRAIQDDLGDVVARAPCTPYAVPNRRPVPLVALWRDVPPGSIADAQDGLPPAGTYVLPRTERVARDYILDPRDLDRRVPAPPGGWTELPGSPSWRMAALCPGPSAG
jgi:hypothetical protein